MLNCQNVTELYSASLERKLTLTEKMSLKVHVMMCPACKNFGIQMHSIRNIARSYAKHAHASDKLEEHHSSE